MAYLYFQVIATVRPADHALLNQRPPTFGTYDVPGGDALATPCELVPGNGEGDCWTRGGWDVWGYEAAKERERSSNVVSAKGVYMWKSDDNVKVVRRKHGY